MKKYTILSILASLLLFACGDGSGYSPSDGENWKIIEGDYIYGKVAYIARPK